MSSSLPKNYLTAHTFLNRVAKLVTLYGVGMVAAGEQFATPLFDALGFGPTSKGLEQDGIEYAVFAFGVVGSILVGWMSLLGSMIDLAANDTDATVRATARHGLMLSTATWFLLDTGFSLVKGEVEHALFNIPFAALLGGPLYIMYKNDPADKSKHS